MRPKLTIARVLAVIGLLAILGSTSRPVEAASAGELRALRKRMVATFRAKRYRSSLSIALRLYKLERAPKYLANVGRCYDLLGDEPRAIEFYRRYLSEGRDHERKRAIVNRIAVLERQFEKRGRIVEITSTPTGARVYLDGEPRGVTPVALMVSRGRHRIELRRKGRPPLTRIVNIDGGPKMHLAFRETERRPVGPTGPRGRELAHAGRFFVGLQIGPGFPLVRSKEATLNDPLNPALFTEKFRPHVQIGLSVGLDVLPSRLETRIEISLALIHKVNACARANTLASATCTTGSTDGVLSVVDIVNVWAFLWKPTRAPFFLIPELGLGGFVVKHKNLGTNAGVSLRVALGLSYRFGRHFEARLLPLRIDTWFPLSGQWNA